MIQRTATAAGRAAYRLRQQTVEPVFGVIKEALGFRRFCLRGFEKASLKYTLAYWRIRPCRSCSAWNLRRSGAD